MQKKLTKTAVEDAEIPAKGDAWIWDTELQGFGLRIQSSGRKTYVVRYRTRDADRTQRKVTICRVGDATPDKARNLARDIFLSVAAGHDPAKEREKTKDGDRGPTVEDLFKARVAHMKAIGRTHTDDVERVLLLAKNNAADSIGRTRAPSDVTPDDIVKFVSTFYKEGHRGAADKARSYLASVFSWAITSANDYTVAERKDWGLKHNPVSDVAKDNGAVGVRNRNLDAEEIHTVWDACQDGNAGFSEGIEVLLRVMIGCGQRVQETLRLDGCDIDLDEAVWKMPAHKTKGRKLPHTIPLPSIIIPDLRRLKEKYGDGPLFPARSDSEHGTLGLVSISHAVRRWFEDEDNTMEPFQPRDLRRTWKSRTHDAGIDRFTRDLIQQHAKGSDTGSKHYDRADYFPQMQEAMRKWSEWLENVLSYNKIVALAA